MLSPAPIEYTQGIFFDRVLRRFEICGVREDQDGSMLVMKCRGCGHELRYNWLKKKPGEAWAGNFGKEIKHRLSSNHAHRKCKIRTLEPCQQTKITSSTIHNNNINNIVIVNLPAVTRIGSAGEPLMCSDIPFPDEKTVFALLTNPETAIPEFVYKQYFTATNPSISAPDVTNTKLKLVQRGEYGNQWVDASFETTVDSIVYKTLDTLDDEFDAMDNNPEFKDWKRREGLTAHIGFDRTDAYKKLQSDVKDVLKSHGVPYEIVY